MSTNFTEEDLLLYIYNELDLSTETLVREELKCNSKLHEEFLRIKNIISQFEPMVLEPNPTSVNICLEFSGHYSSEQHEI